MKGPNMVRQFVTPLCPGWVRYALLMYTKGVMEERVVIRRTDGALRYTVRRITPDVLRGDSVAANPN